MTFFCNFDSGQVVFNAKFCEESKSAIKNGLRQVLYPVLGEKPRWSHNFSIFDEKYVFLQLLDNKKP